MHGLGDYRMGMTEHASAILTAKVKVHMAIDISRVGTLS
jgi:hypothetical protein